MVISRTLGGNINPGDFLLAHKDRNNNSIVVVCQVQQVIYPECLKALWWVESDNAAPLCPDAFPNLLSSRIKELFADSVSVIHIDDAVDVIFVFKANILESILTDVAGMSHVFFHKRCKPFGIQLFRYRELSLPYLVFFNNRER
jgi:hypothetical protein